MGFTETYHSKTTKIMDKYTKKYIRLIKQAKSDQELSDIIDNIYTDGFDDGEQSAGTDQDKYITQRKLKNLPFTEVIKDPRILMALWNHFNYRIMDISSYDELTKKEKEIISKPIFEHITEKGGNL